MADEQVAAVGEALVEAWVRFLAQLRELRPESIASVESLAAWVGLLDGENPARGALEAAYQDAALRHATWRAELDRLTAEVNASRDSLLAEQQQLMAGVDHEPMVPHTRSPGIREDLAGAPFWRLVEFRDDVDEAERAGLEAALEASGVLDAWVSTNGDLLRHEDGLPLLDAQLLPGHAADNALSDWLAPAVGADSGVSPAIVQSLLAGIACGDGDDGASGSWVSSSGQYRLGTLAGRWTKPKAEFIGFEARAAARARRLSEIAEQLVAVEAKDRQLKLDYAELSAAQVRAGTERAAAPQEALLRSAHQAVALAATAAARAAGKAAEADLAYQRTAGELRDAHQRLTDDAEVLKVPHTAQALEA